MNIDIFSEFSEIGNFVQIYIGVCDIIPSINGLINVIFTVCTFLQIFEKCEKYVKRETFYIHSMLFVTSQAPNAVTE